VPEPFNNSSLAFDATSSLKPASLSDEERKFLVIPGFRKAEKSKVLKVEIFRRE
jgi:hypothetical protein